MSAADQTERWTLCIDRSMNGPLYVPSVARNCAHRPPPPPFEHVEVVPASALDAARERAERAEAELAEGETFAVVHLHQSGSERWVHTSGKPNMTCDLSTYIETITVRRVTKDNP